MGVYGDFLDSFPELIVQVYFPAKNVYIPAVYDNVLNGDIHRQKVARSTNIMTIRENGMMYVASAYEKDIAIGDVFINPYNECEMKIVGCVPYGQSAGYNVYHVQRVEGHNSTQTDKLNIKEAEF